MPDPANVQSSRPRPCMSRYRDQLCQRPHNHADAHMFEDYGGNEPTLTWTDEQLINEQLQEQLRIIADAIAKTLAIVLTSVRGRTGEPTR